jgi:serine/threonine-protein kinase
MIVRRIASYDIGDKLGEGGMGQVYRAHDTTLNRDVAIKLLPDSVANDAERLARFRREAQVLAALNHPNIAHVYGFEEAGEVRALVMELVEGPTLADRIAQGRLPIDEALAIAKQIADALEAAHERGIVHRDLKPSNIKLRPDGAVKVLDFGLAKAVDPAAAGSGAQGIVTNSPTITSPAMLTGAGMILGTAAYMSPEQAKGRPADKRSDVWAFGCVLFEMLAGKRAFEGDDVTDTLAAVLRGEPDWAALPADLPPAVRLALRRCLERDRNRQLPDVSAFRFLLTEPALLGGDTNAPAIVARPAARRKVAFGLAAALLLGAAVSAAAFWTLRRAPAPVVTRFTYQLPADQRFTNGGRSLLAISPDGTRMAYVANSRLYVKAMWEPDAKSLAGPITGGITTPVFSPDSQWIAYWSAPGVLNKIAVTGGTPVQICPLGNPYGMSWSNGSVWIGSPRGVLRVADTGGTPEMAIPVAQNEISHGPQLLDDGRTVLFTLGAPGSDQWDKAQIVAQPLGGGPRKTLLNGGTDGRVLSTGHLVYLANSVLYGVAFDQSRLEARGGPVPIVDGVAPALSGQTGSGQFAISRTGTLLYMPGSTASSQAGYDVALADRGGKVERLPLPRRVYQTPRFSPDGRRLALMIDDRSLAHVWVWDVGTDHDIRQLTFDGHNGFPIWTRDGERLTFSSDREGDNAIFWQHADGSGRAERLTRAARDEFQTPSSWSADGDTLLFSSHVAGTFSLQAFTAHDRKVNAIADVRSANEIGATFSPDGRWIAYQMLPPNSPLAAIYVRPFPITDAKYRVGEGINPFWGVDGKSLFFAANPGAGEFSMVNITTTPAFAVSKPVLIPRPNALGGGPGQPRPYDIAPDGEHFILFVGSALLDNPQIRAVLNWSQELLQRIPRP